MSQIVLKKVNITETSVKNALTAVGYSSFREIESVWRDCVSKQIYLVKELGHDTFRFIGDQVMVNIEMPLSYFKYIEKADIKKLPWCIDILYILERDLYDIFNKMPIQMQINVETWFNKFIERDETYPEETIESLSDQNIGFLIMDTAKSLGENEIQMAKNFKDRCDDYANMSCYCIECGAKVINLE